MNKRSSDISKELSLFYSIKRSDKGIITNPDWLGIWDDYAFTETRESNIGSDKLFKDYFQAIRIEKYIAGEEENKKVNRYGEMSKKSSPRITPVKHMRTNFTHDEMLEVLTQAEVRLINELIKEMNDENYVYLYQIRRGSERIMVIDKIAKNLEITRNGILNSISRILNTQKITTNWFIHRMGVIDGEIFISPELAVSKPHLYDGIYKRIHKNLK